MIRTNEAIFAFKPDAAGIMIPVSDCNHSLYAIGGALLTSAGLKIVNEVDHHMLPEEVCEMYGKVLSPNPDDDAQWGIAWKSRVIAHLSSEPIKALHVRDEDGTAHRKATAIKQALRTIYAQNGDPVKNIAHVPDVDEFDTVYNIFFGGR